MRYLHKKYKNTKNRGWYTHKTSGLERSGFKRSGNEKSGLERSGVKKVRSTKGLDAKSPEEKVRMQKVRIPFLSNSTEKYVYIFSRLFWRKKIHKL